MDTDNCNTIQINRRKVNKKQRRCQHILEKETGVIACNKPTKFLAICNAGLANGLTEEVVLNAFLPFGSVERLVFVPGKTCCFVVCKDVDGAQKAFDGINGQLNIGQNGKPIYLSFTETVPDVKAQDPTDTPPGLILLDDFISEGEENLLLSTITWDNTDTNNLKHRNVKHYGYEFKYGINNVDKNNPLPSGIPPQCNFVFQRLHDRTQFTDFTADQLTINEYKPGQGIPPHIDTHSAFEDPILSLSLGSSVNMDFRHKDGRQASILLPQRSLLIMSGESRYAWSHGITPRKYDVVSTDNGLTVHERNVRLSFTFRQVRKGDCRCEYVGCCDSYKTKIGGSTAADLELTHVHKVYEEIAAHFSDTRHKPWPNVIHFLDAFPVGSILLDVGCGNGKYLDCNKSVFEIGCDYSKNLMKICRERRYEVFNCDCLNIPIKNDVIDGIICIAVVHHLGNKERRLQAVEEMLRVLRIGGQALIYVWAKDQQRNTKSSYLKQDRKNRKDDERVPESSQSPVQIASNISLPVHVNRTQFAHQDVLVPWKRKGNSYEGAPTDLFLRYYHVFEENEIEQICKSLTNVDVIKSYYDQGNWCVIIQKTNK